MKIINKNNLLGDHFYQIIIFFVILKFFTSYFIPLNIHAGSPHDDTLFYDNAINLSKLNWLGDYNQLTLIKGPIFPFFLSISIKLGIPFRIWEAFLICGSTLYFIYVLKKKSLISEKFLCVLFIIIIFDPFQYISIYFRVFRENVYPWFLLLLFTAILEIWGKILSKEKLKIKDSFLLALLIFLFNFTREEGIWIGPYLLISLILFFIFSYRNKKLINLTIAFCLFLFFYFSFANTLKIVNYFAYNYYGTTLFKDKYYVKGFSSLFRIKQESDFFTEAPNKETWNIIFNNSRETRNLRNYIFNGNYNNWAIMGCEQVQNNFFYNQGKKEALNCNGKMNFGYLIFAFLDALHFSGYNTPIKKINFMKNLSKDIDNYCLSNPLKCRKIPPTMLAPEIWSIKTFFSAILKIPRAFSVSILGHASGNLHIQSSGPHDKVAMMRENYGGIFFNKDSSSKQMFNIIDANTFKNIVDKQGYIDHLDYTTDGKLHVSGWFTFDKNNKKNKVDIFVLNKNNLVCETKPSYFRNDISEEFKTGFVCSFNYQLKKDEEVYLDVFAKTGEKIFELNKTENVKSLLKNRFDENCYIKNNSDIKLAVERGEFKSGYEHYSLVGKFENRLCRVLFKEIINLKEFSYSHSSFSKVIVKFYEYLNKVYAYLGYLCLIFPILAFYINLKQKNFFSMFVIFSLSSLLFTRLYLISLLDTVFLAPITVSYLSTASFLVHFLTFYSVIYLFNYFYENK